MKGESKREKREDRVKERKGLKGRGRGWRRMREKNEFGNDWCGRNQKRLDEKRSWDELESEQMRHNEKQRETYRK